MFVLQRKFHVHWLAKIIYQTKENDKMKMYLNKKAALDVQRESKYTLPLA